MGYQVERPGLLRACAAGGRCRYCRGRAQRLVDEYARHGFIVAGGVAAACIAVIAVWAVTSANLRALPDEAIDLSRETKSHAERIRLRPQRRTSTCPQKRLGFEITVPFASPEIRASPVPC